MTHYPNGFSPDVECEACNGHGEVCGVNPNRRSRFVGQDDLSPDDFTVECAACCGTGFRPMTQDELDAAAERQAEETMSEPPMTMAEQHRAAFAQKQESRR